MSQGRRRPRAALRFALIAVMACTRPAGAVSDVRIEQLEAELHRSANPDSVRIELALAHRAVGDVEHRLRALWLLEDLRPTHMRDLRFLREYALTLEACHRYDLACEAAERLAAMAPDSVDIRMVCVRAAVRSLFRYERGAFLGDAQTQLDSILVRDPTQRDALRLKSLLCAWAALRNPAGAPAAHRQGLVLAEAIRQLDPDDPGARLLEGVHRHGLGDEERAEICFRTAIASMDPADRRTYLRPPAAFDTVSVANLSRAWRQLDPIPLSAVNEGQLEYWCRLTLADAFFGDPDRHVRGWQTDPGQVLVRYGAPEAGTFEPAYLAGGDASFSGVPASAGALPAPEAPTCTWTCRIDGRVVPLTFRDVALSGTWHATPETQEKLAVLDETVPVQLLPSAPAPGAIVHLLASSFAGRVAVTVGLDPRLLAWPSRQGSPPVMSIQVVDEGGTPVVSDRWQITQDDRCPASPTLPLAQTSREFPLAPGDYALTAEISDGRGAPRGTARIPFTVGAFPRRELAVSDLELVVEGSTSCPAQVIARGGQLWLPCALPLVGDARTLSAYFEIYDLAVDPESGQERFQVRYTLVPHAYTVALAARGMAARRSSPGDRLDETILTHRNFVDVLFPVERRRAQAGTTIDKTAGLPLKGLDVGAYDLIVSVRDLVGGASASSRRTLTILTDGEIDAAASGGVRR